MKTFLYKSNRANKKFVLDLDGKKRIYFGASGYRDFTLMNDPDSEFYEPDVVKRNKVKLNYMKRHAADKLDEISPGSLSYYLLWNKKTLAKSIKDFENIFGLKIVDMTDEIYKKMN